MQRIARAVNPPWLRSVFAAAQDQGQADWEAVSKEGSVLGEQKKKKNRRQRYKENKVSCTCCMLADCVLRYEQLFS